MRESRLADSTEILQALSQRATVTPPECVEDDSSIEQGQCASCYSKPYNTCRVHAVYQSRNKHKSAPGWESVRFVFVDRRARELQLPDAPELALRPGPRNIHDDHVAWTHRKKMIANRSFFEIPGNKPAKTRLGDQGRIGGPLGKWQGPAF
ncbi:hypothetical protein BCR34DRAFT_556344 [Clohesyomyces aquaticus]|uniref:Uncharacterized protein n=1 Tax=Clohesyomyces aquaticus TaxID=1231657 RepID=A0A1Y2A393_9PLEO|nr:hypothetical protein BCR34DRAFT_556344 [Clohesyomyces aquaticus]